MKTVEENQVTIGKKIRNERKKRKLTLKQVSEKSHLSISYLSEIERDITSPSIATLKRIANALDISMASLFGDPSDEQEQQEDVIGKANWKKIVYSSASKIHWYLLTQNVERKMMEPLVAVLEPGASSGATGSPHPQGEEFVMVLEGSVELWVGSKRYVLNEGDSLYFNATIPHRYANLSSSNSVMLAISSPPGF